MVYSSHSICICWNVHHIRKLRWPLYWLHRRKTPFIRCSVLRGIWPSSIYQSPHSLSFFAPNAAQGVCWDETGGRAFPWWSVWQPSFNPSDTHQPHLHNRRIPPQSSCTCVTFPSSRQIFSGVTVFWGETGLDYCVIQSTVVYILHSTAGISFHRLTVP